jgi:predicted adenine nucleotide alpha hydrolase (AANH) superfamily ATPase
LVLLSISSTSGYSDSGNLKFIKTAESLNFNKKFKNPKMYKINFLKMDFDKNFKKDKMDKVSMENKFYKIISENTTLILNSCFKF